MRRVLVRESPMHRKPINDDIADFLGRPVGYVDGFYLHIGDLVRWRSNYGEESTNIVTTQSFKGQRENFPGGTDFLMGFANERFGENRSFKILEIVKSFNEIRNSDMKHTYHMIYLVDDKGNLIEKEGAL